MTTRDQAIEAILTCLYGYGDMYTGCHPRETAAEWYDAGFATPDQVARWCDIGVWDPWTAAVLAAAGMRPRDVQAASAAMLESHGAIVRVLDAYTLGCPIYSCCNGDLSPGKLIKAWKSEREIR